jgi:hypothetical protein
VDYTQEVAVNRSEKDEDYDKGSQLTPLPLLNWDWTLLNELQKKNVTIFRNEWPTKTETHVL